MISTEAHRELQELATFTCNSPCPSCGECPHLDMVENNQHLCAQDKGQSEDKRN